MDIIGIPVEVILILTSTAVAVVYLKRSDRKDQENEERQKTKERVEKLERETKIQQREAERLQRRKNIAYRRWVTWYTRHTIDDISTMTGIEFEKYLVSLLVKLGYQQVRTTTYTDQGGDIVAVTPDGKKAVIQAKRWSKSVGNKVIQEILGAMLYYKSEVGIVITNNRFTSPARHLASCDQRITLFDGSWIQSQILHFDKNYIPEYSWDSLSRTCQKTS